MRPVGGNRDFSNQTHQNDQNEANIPAQERTHLSDRPERSQRRMTKRTQHRRSLNVD
jgi:hypothetical protein